MNTTYHSSIGLYHHFSLSRARMLGEIIWRIFENLSSKSFSGVHFAQKFYCKMSTSFVTWNSWSCESLNFFNNKKNLIIFLGNLVWQWRWRWRWRRQIKNLRVLTQADCLWWQWWWWWWWWWWWLQWWWWTATRCLPCPPRPPCTTTLTWPRPGRWQPEVTL